MSSSFTFLQLVKLLELREANHIEFCRIKNLVDEIIHMYQSSELSEILKLLTDPTWVATGLRIDFEILVSSNKWICPSYMFIYMEAWCTWSDMGERVFSIRSNMLTRRSPPLPPPLPIFFKKFFPPTLPLFLTFCWSCTSNIPVLLVQRHTGLRSCRAPRRQRELLVPLFPVPVVHRQN